MCLECSPVRCDVMKMKEDPKRVKLSPRPPLVLIMVTGLVAWPADSTAGEEETHLHSLSPAHLTTHLSSTR